MLRLICFMRTVFASWVHRFVSDLSQVNTDIFFWRGVVEALRASTFQGLEPSAIALLRKYCILPQFQL